MATWSPIPNGDGTIGNWVKETGSGTPIFGEIDEGIAAADNTGIKNTTLNVYGFFLLSDSPADMADGSGITAVTIRLRTKQSGWVDDTNVSVAAIFFKADEVTSLGGLVSYVNTSTTYTNSAALDTYTGDPTSWTNLTKTELDGLRLGLKCQKTTNMAADSVTFFIDTFDIVVTYTPTGPAFVPYRNPMFQLLPH